MTPEINKQDKHTIKYKNKDYTINIGLRLSNAIEICGDIAVHEAYKRDTIKRAHSKIRWLLVQKKKPDQIQEILDNWHAGTETAFVQKRFKKLIDSVSELNTEQQMKLSQELLDKIGNDKNTI